MDLIMTKGIEAECSYCGAAGRSYSITDVAELVDRAFAEHYHQTREDVFGNRPGDETTSAISDAAGIEEEPAEDIRTQLEDKHYNHELAQMGEEGAFHKNAYYALNEPDDVIYQADWYYLEKSLKTEARFFSQIARTTLDKVFDGIDSHRTLRGARLTVVAGKGRRISALYRARVFQSDSKLKEALIRPDREIGPPSAILATAGRMNARGISVFYGSTKPKIALAELRPPVGSDVVIARFDLVKDVRLLDIRALASLDVQGSIFDPGYRDRLERAKFLRSLSRRITRPILPDDEVFEYIITQAVADYLANVLELEGVIYSSAQHKGGVNVALFHHAALVEPYTLPAGSDVEVYTGYSDDEGDHTDISVCERIPDDEKQSSPKATEDDYWSVLHEPSPPPEPYLKLDLESIRVHRVESVRFRSIERKISRSRVRKSDKDDF